MSNKSNVSRVNINSVLNQLPEYFLADDIRALYPNKPEGSITRWISTMVERGQVERLRRAHRNNEHEHPYRAMYRRVPTSSNTSGIW